MVSGEGRVQKIKNSWRKEVAGSWITDGNMSLDVELLDILGVVMEKPGALIDWSCHSFMSLRNAIAHSSRGLGWFRCLSVSPLVVRWKSIFMYNLAE